MPENQTPLPDDAVPKTSALSASSVNSSRKWKRLLLALLSTVATLFLVEGILQVADWPQEDPVWETRPATAFKFASSLDYHLIQPEYDIPFQTNSLGLRDDEIRSKEGYRILLLGDSFTCGYGVEREKMFGDVLERNLAVDVINAGVGGYEIVHQLHYFQTEGKKFNADLVIYALYLGNDLTNNQEWRYDPLRGLERADGSPPLPRSHSPKLITLLKRNLALRRAVHAWRDEPLAKKAWLPGKRELALYEKRSSDEAKHYYDESRRLLHLLHEAVDRSGATLLIVTLPSPSMVDDHLLAGKLIDGEQFMEEYDPLKPSHEIEIFCSEEGLRYLPLVELLRADRASQDQPLFYHHDGHLTPHGHQRVAEHLTAYLEKSIYGRQITAAKEAIKRR